MVATHEDVTERRSAERRLAENAAALKRANERFEVAINNMPQGVCLFDAEQRVVIANTRYAELYHLEPAQVKAGTSLTQIFEDRRKRGTNFAVAPDTYLGGNVPKEHEVLEVADGRIVSISRRLMSDGGWLTTHEDITDRAQSERRVAYMAQHDMLTGLANRALFTEKLEDVSKRHKRHGDGVAVLMLDLDNFKVVNDSLGHSGGDELLRALTARLLAAARDCDTVARLGGDEFVLVCDGVLGEEHAMELAVRVERALESPFVIGGRQHVVRSSIGVVVDDGGSTPEVLLRDADTAMYRAKENGRGRCEMFSPVMRVRAVARLRAETELQVAVERGELRIHYQPLFEIADRRLVGMEALVRWERPDHGLVPPNEFIPVAEETGLIVGLGEWVLNTAATQMAEWQAQLEGADQLGLAINVSGRQLLSPGFERTVAAALERSGLPADRFSLEVTESMLMEHAESPVSVLAELRRLGVHIVLDDFGTGYSSLSRLKDFPLDVLKIDNAFAQGAPNRRDCAAAIASILALAQGLDIATTAEGVETDEQADYLRSAGIDTSPGLFVRTAATARGT